MRTVRLNIPVELVERALDGYEPYAKLPERVKPQEGLRRRLETEVEAHFGREPDDIYDQKAEFTFEDAQEANAFARPHR